MIQIKCLITKTIILLCIILGCDIILYVDTC